jgi:3',5'-cyclic AMP phosphodiesterase CpdA
MTYPFTTCPMPGRPMDVVFYGDSRSGPSAHARVVAQVRKHNPEMIFESGDIAPNGTYAQYRDEFFPVVKELVATTPFMAAPGNHDASSSYSGNYGSIFPSPRAPGQPWQPYYAFLCGNAMFIALDSNDVMDDAQQKFLTGKLQAAYLDPTVQHVFVWFHHAAYSPGSHGDNLGVQGQWVPLFNDPRYKVTAVFAGHDHIYARMKDSSDVLYLVSGGAGAGLYSDTRTSRATKVVSKSAYNFVSLHIAGDAVSGVAYDDTGTELDRFSVSKPHVDPPDLGGSPPPDMAVGENNDPPPVDPGEGCALAGFSDAGHGRAGSAGLGLLTVALGVVLFRRRSRAAQPA